MSNSPHIEIKGARQHNLKGVDVRLPRGRLVVITGVSGSGKSSLAFDTIYAEGQRRYVESLSTYARQFFDRLPKPDADSIEGLPPTVAVEQKTGVASPRSTVATTTEIYDFLRLLFARAGRPHCPQCGRPIRRRTVQEIVEDALSRPAGTRLMVLAPLVRDEKGAHDRVFDRVRREGFVRVRVDGEMAEAASPPRLDARRGHRIEAVVDRLALGKDVRRRLSESIELALRQADGLVLLLYERGDGWEETLYTERFACPEHGVTLDELSTRLFSFNSPYGACPACAGLGVRMEFDEDLIAPDPRRPLEEAIEPAARDAGPFAEHCRHMVEEFAEQFEADLDEPLAALPERKRRILLHGAQAVRPRPKHGFEGVIPALARRLAAAETDAERDRLQAYMSEALCPACRGARLRPEALAVRVDDVGICDLTRLSVEAALDRVRRLALPTESAAVAEPILDEVGRRLRFLLDIGLGYLTLDRRSATLSGGEMQRIRLATQMGMGLVGLCYVLDEPTIGLHPADTEKLIAALRRLRDAGASVIVVEHDADVIRAADHVLELGPGPGDAGGRLVAQCGVDDLVACAESPTGHWLAGRLEPVGPTRRRPPAPGYALTVKGARANNLKNIDVAIPLGVLCCVSGVSGSGKSTLVMDVLRRALAKRLHRARARPGDHDDLLGWELVDKVVEIDQSPIGRSPRSNAATYTNVFAAIRRLFAQTREARRRGYQAARFSFNAKGGRCEACQGQGARKIDMQFLPDLFVVCDACKGARYNPETLEVKYRGRNIAEVLEMNVEEAAEFFKHAPGVRRGLDTLLQVGLGYLRLGQPGDTLSGGEAQRVKLAAELSRRSRGRTLYLLDEPTTGLHAADIRRLLDVLHQLVDKGDTVLVIEHNLDVIAAADYVIDLGPGPGEAGGRVVAAGAPEEIAAHPESLTGRVLRRILAQP